MALCPCGSGSNFDGCCGPIIAGVTPAPTAEALMRSRYTAFARGNFDHIENTYARESRDLHSPPGVRDMFGSMQWIDLRILDTSQGGEGDQIGVVDFAARFSQDGNILTHRERSNFRRENGKWVYVDGVSPDAGSAGKIGRNDPCPCGSGKKYKKCCGG